MPPITRLPVTEADVRVINGELVALHGSGRKTTPISFSIEGAEVAIDNSGFAVLGGTTAQEVFESVDFQLDNLGGAFPLDNDEWATWKDSSNTPIDVLKLSASDQVDLQSPNDLNLLAGDKIGFSTNGNVSWIIDQGLLRPTVDGGSAIGEQNLFNVGTVYTWNVIASSSAPLQLRGNNVRILDNNGNIEWTFENDGDLVPGANLSQDIGSSSSILDRGYLRSISAGSNQMTLYGQGIRFANWSPFSVLWEIDTQGRLIPRASSQSNRRIGDGTSGTQLNTVNTLNVQSVTGDLFLQSNDRVGIVAAGDGTYGGSAGQCTFQFGSNSPAEAVNVRWTVGYNSIYPGLDEALDIGLASRKLNAVYTHKLVGDFTDGLHVGYSESTPIWQFEGSTWAFYPFNDNLRDIGKVGNNVRTVYARSIASDTNLEFNAQQTLVSGMTVQGDLIVEQDLIVSGTKTVLNTEELLVEDNVITLNSTHTGVPALDAGMEVNRGSSANARFLWDESADYFVLGISGSEERVLTDNHPDPITLGNTLKLPNDVPLLTSTSGGAEIDLLKVTNNDDALLRAEAGDLLLQSDSGDITFLTGGSNTWSIKPSGKLLATSGSNAYIGVDTTDGADNGSLTLSASDAIGTGSLDQRSGRMTLHGLEHGTNGGGITFHTSSATGAGDILFNTTINGNTGWTMSRNSSQLISRGGGQSLIIRDSAGDSGTFVMGYQFAARTEYRGNSNSTDPGVLRFYSGSNRDHQIEFFTGNQTGGSHRHRWTMPGGYADSPNFFEVSELVFEREDAAIHAATAAGSDTGSLTLGAFGREASPGLGPLADESRGAMIKLFGSDHITNADEVQIFAGTGSGTGSISFRTDGQEQWKVNTAGQLLAVSGSPAFIGVDTQAGNDTESLTIAATDTVSLTRSPYIRLYGDDFADTSLRGSIVLGTAAEGSGNQTGRNIYFQNSVFSNHRIKVSTSTGVISTEGHAIAGIFAEESTGETRIGQQFSSGGASVSVYGTSHTSEAGKAIIKTGRGNQPDRDIEFHTGEFGGTWHRWTMPGSAQTFSGSSLVYTQDNGYLIADTQTGADNTRLVLGAFGRAANGLPSDESRGACVELHGKDHATNPDELILKGGTTQGKISVHSNIEASASGTLDIGTASEPFANLHVDTLYVTAISGVELGGGAYDNEEWALWRNAADNADLEVIRANSSNSTEIQTPFGNFLYFLNGSSDEILRLSKSAGNSLCRYGGSLSLQSDVNTAQLSLAGGPGASRSAGAFITAYGRSHSTEPGNITIQAASNAGASIDFNTGDTIDFRRGNTLRWQFDGSSHLVPAASGTYDIGTSSTPVRDIYASSITTIASPGAKLSSDGSRGILDSSENNDLRIQRNGVPFIQLENGNIIFTQPVTMESDLNVSGTNNIINTEQLLVEDNIITLNAGTSGTPTLDAGIEVDRGSSTFAQLLWDESEDYFVAGISGSLEKIMVATDSPSDMANFTADILPNVSGSLDIGSASAPFADIFSRSIVAGGSLLEEGQVLVEPISQEIFIGGTNNSGSNESRLTIAPANATHPSSSYIQLNGLNAPGAGLILHTGSSLFLEASGGSHHYLRIQNGISFYRNQGSAGAGIIHNNSDTAALLLAGGQTFDNLNPPSGLSSFILSYGRSHATQAGNLHLGAHTSGKIRFSTGASDKWSIENDGDFLPGASGVYDIGSVSSPVRLLVSQSIEASAISSSDKVEISTGSGVPTTKVTIQDNNFTPLLVTSAAQTGVGSPVTQVRVPDTAGNRGGYGIATVSGGDLAGMTAEVVTGGAYPDSEGILELWYQEENSTQRILRGSQADGVALYVDSAKRFELRPDRSIYHKSHDNFANSEYRRQTLGHICTTSGAETAYTLTPISNGAAWVTAKLVAFDNANNDSFWVELKTGVRRHDGGSAAIIGSVVKTSDRESATTWDADFDTSGNDLRLRVTSVSGVVFTGTIEYQQSSGE